MGQCVPPSMRLQIELLWLSGRRAYDLPSNSAVSPRTQQAFPRGPPPAPHLPQGLYAQHWLTTVGGNGIYGWQALENISE
ncbi:hypothetical protein CesoFtcFv8_007776 [Champsocephalus esox]|uniref:Uncharacterized protein n=2 Tax=Champsocephalus TaxID=52236 RepID=A0AAN8HYN9_CHAGU|nr:hypothetical protein CesoFtcFv8_007776 [Champsocephalus esox]KAK5928299.1 hypothetical protein CgunFtcFv8_013372 [Champsocephalus gunnari]